MLKYGVCMRCSYALARRLYACFVCSSTAFVCVWFAHARWSCRIGAVMAAAAAIAKGDIQRGFKIYAGGLFALTQICDGFIPVLIVDPVSHAAACATAIQAQHQSGPLRRAAMDMRIDA